MTLVLFAGLSAAAPVPKALKAKPPARSKIEPLKDEKVYSVEFDDMPFVKVAEKLERLTGLMFLSKDVPKLNITLKAEKVCVAELFAQLDEILYPQGWVLARKSQSFTVLKVKDLGDPKQRIHFTTVQLEDLARRSPYQPVCLHVSVGEKNVKAGKAVAAGIDGPGFDAKELADDGFTLRGRVMDVQKFVDGMSEHIKK